MRGIAKIGLLVTVILFGCCFADLDAQQYNFDSYGLEDGLAQSQVCTMMLDSRGMIWFGTVGGGISIFDGISFKTLNTSDSLPDNHIWGIMEDRSGLIWIATEGGLCYYDGNTVHNPKKLNKEDKVFWSLAQDKEGNIWAGTSDNGALVFKMDSSGNMTDPKRILPKKSINCLAVDNGGKMWIGHFGTGVSVFTNGNSFEINTQNGLPDNFVNDICIDKGNRALIATEGGLSIIEGNDTMTLTVSDGLTSNRITGVIIDRSKNIWLSTFGGGVCRYRPDGTVTAFTEQYGLCSNNVYTVLDDGSGSIWTGTDGAGACKFLGEAFTYLNKSDGLQNHMVMSVSCASDSSVYFGTEAAGLYRTDIKVSKPQRIPLNIDDEFAITGLYNEGQDKVWIGTYGHGLLKLEAGKIKDLSLLIPGSEIMCILKGRDNSMWFGSEGAGLTRLYPDGKTINNIRIGDGLMSDNLWSLAFDKDGHLWVGTDKGISIVKDEEVVRSYTTEDGLVSNDINALTTDENGHVWIATGRGLSVWDGDKFHNYTVTDGLESNNIYTVESLGRVIYIGTERGMDKLMFTREMLIYSIHHYGPREGFKGIETNANASDIDVTGNIWWGTIKGLTNYRKDKDIPNLSLPKMHITGVRLFYESAGFNAYCKGFERWTHLPKNLVLPYNRNHLTFDYIGINMKSPDKVSYRYMLEGFDNTWSNAQNRHEVTYSNLPPGRYTFKVVGANEEGLINYDAATYSFVIEAPFWKTTFFYVMVVIAGLALIYLIIIIRTRGLHKRQRELEEMVRVRTEKIRRQSAELEKLSVVARETAQGIIIADPEGRIEWINHGLVRLTGYEFDDFINTIGRTLTEVSSYPDFQSVLNEVRQSGKTVSYDSCHNHLDGRVIWTTATLTPILDDNGRLKKFINVYTDITERRRTREILEQQNKDIMDSLNYAKHIQEAILPERNVLQSVFPDSFVMLHPRDIVSGDFYWFSKTREHLIIAAADCTGHGVPGAFMSMIGNEFLHQIIKEKDVTGPEMALTLIDKRIRKALHQIGASDESKDGMDIGMCEVNLETNVLSFSGAHRPLILIRDGKVIKTNGDKLAIGGYFKKEKSFGRTEIKMQKGDCYYLFSDGITDQFGGPKGKKYLIKRLVELLVEVNDQPMPDQKKAIWSSLRKWMGEIKQVDDILLIGFRVE